MRISGNKRDCLLILLAALIQAVPLFTCPLDAFGGESYSKWRNGPRPDSTYFPIGVWLQSPSRASQYKAAGFKTISIFLSDKQIRCLVFCWAILSSAFLWFFVLKKNEIDNNLVYLLIVLNIVFICFFSNGLNSFLMTFGSKFIIQKELASCKPSISF